MGRKAKRTEVEPFVTLQELSEIIGIPEGTLRRYMQDDLISWYRPNRRNYLFRVSEVIKDLEKFRHKADPEPFPGESIAGVILRGD